MKTEIISSVSEFRKLESEWNLLLQESLEDNLFLTWEWVIHSIEAVTREPELFVVCVRDANNRLLGVAPFYVARMYLAGCMPFTVLRFITDLINCSEYAAFPLQTKNARPAAQALIRTLLQHKRRWDLIWIPKIATWNGAFERVKNLFVSEDGMWLRYRSRNFSAISLPASIQEYYQSLSSKARYQTRKEIKSVFGAQQMQFRLCESEAQVASFLEQLFALHHARWLEKGEPGTFKRRPEEENFYRGFMPQARLRGWLCLAGVFSGERARAVQIGCMYRGIFHSLQEGFDPHSVKGIGNALRAKVIEHCIQQGVQEYDFLGGISEHKLRWQAQRRDGMDLMIGKRACKNLPLRVWPIWPGGRILQE